MTNRKGAGFTLIELVIVIVILGVLAAIAAPRFIDLSEDAERSALRAQASAISSASAINFAAAMANGDDLVDTSGGCTVNTVNQLLEGELRDGYSVAEDEGFSETTRGRRATCTLTDENLAGVNEADFMLIYVAGSGNGDGD